MRALISADMEGVTGVTCAEDCTLGTPEFARFQPIFTDEVNSVALGLFDAGVEEVLVCEAHGFMRNLLLERLDPRVRMITGKRKTYPMMEGIQSRPELVAFVGYHAPAGGEGVLSHTLIGPILVEVRLNGQVMSEGLLNAAVAAEYGARVVLVSGDDRTSADAGLYAPNAELVEVKRALGRYTADCASPAATFPMLRAAATRAVDAGDMRAPEPPYVCDVEFAVANAAEATALIPRVDRLDARRIRFRVDTAGDLSTCLTTICRIATATAGGTYG